MDSVASSLSATSIMLGAIIGILIGGALASTFVSRIFTGPAALATIVAYVWLAERWMSIQGRVTRAIVKTVVRLVFFIIACGPYALVGAFFGAHRADLALIVAVVIIVGTLLWLFVFFPDIHIGF